MMRRVAAITIALALAGCVSPPKTAPAVISKPVILPCQVDVPQRPVMPADTLTGSEDIWTLGVTLWADRKAREAYEIAIRTRLEGCVKPAEP